MRAVTPPSTECYRCRADLPWVGGICRACEERERDRADAIRDLERDDAAWEREER